MSANATVEEIVARNHLGPVPENIRKLTQLVATQDARTDEIAKLIGEDKELKVRLLRAANPRAETEDDYNVTTVEGALMRSGVGCAMLLAMSDPLIRAVKRTFEAMAELALEDVSPGTVGPLEDMHYMSQLTFEGKATGSVVLRFSKKTAACLVERVLGCEADDSAVTMDVLGELGNVVAGNFKSNLCDAGLDCRLSPPTVTMTDEFRLKANGGLAERTGYKGDVANVFVDIQINPWG